MCADCPMVPTMMGFCAVVGRVWYFVNVFLVTALRSEKRQSATVVTTSASLASWGRMALSAVSCPAMVKPQSTGVVTTFRSSAMVVRAKSISSMERSDFDFMILIVYVCYFLMTSFFRPSLI